MKKWTTSSSSSNANLGMTTNSNGVGSIIGSCSKVSLTKILTFRPHLNEIECWALLGQTAHALQDVLLKANGRFNRKISSNNGDNRRENSNLTLPAQCCPIVYPDRLLTSTTGKIILDNSSSLTLDCQNDFIHPLLGSTTFIGGSSAADNNPLYREQYTEHELEQLGTYSLGKTIQACHCLDSSSTLTDLLNKMTSPIDSVTLLHVLECVAHQWKLLVGSSPISRFVAQLCKLTLGWTSTTISSTTSVSSSKSSRPTFLNNMLDENDFAHADHEQEISHIEFSRLNDSTSSSGTTSPTLPRPPQRLTNQAAGGVGSLPMPISSSPINNNNHLEQKISSSHSSRPPKLPPKGIVPPPLPPTSSAGSLSSCSSTNGGPTSRAALKRKAPQRNPSRLYRIVKPLTEMATTPSPATNRCIGPEFFVMQDNHPKVLDLATNYSRKEFVSKQVTIVLLCGQRYFIHVNATTITAGELLDNVLRDQDIKEAPLFSLALFKNEEYWPVSNETKISKIAPSGWKDPRLASSSSNRILAESVTLYQRLKYLPDDIDSSFKDPANKHQFYLQLRQDILLGKYPMDLSQYLSLAGMALQVEFGDFSQDVHDEVYFDLEHYLPKHAIIQDDSSQSTNTVQQQSIRASLIKLHKAHLGQSQSKTEMKYCQELLRHSNYGFHMFKVSTDKKCQHSKLLGIHLKGIFLFEASPPPTEFSNKNHHQNYNNISHQLPHQILASYFWHKITRIQYSSGKFHLLIQDSESRQSHKLKYYTSTSEASAVESYKSKLMFDLSACHHQHSNQLRLQQNESNRVESSHTRNNTDVVQYKEPQRPMRSLKSRLMPRRQSSQHKLYTTAKEISSNSTNSSSLRGSLRRSTTVAPSSMQSSSHHNQQQQPKNSMADPKYLVKRLAHYSSMADALVGGGGGNSLQKKKTQNSKLTSKNSSDLNVSDKENKTPDQQNYRYKVYLEPEEDIKVKEVRVPLQEKPIIDISGSTPITNTPKSRPAMMTVFTNPSARRKSENNFKSTSLQIGNKKGGNGNRRISCGVSAIKAKAPPEPEVVQDSASSNVLRMGTRISLSALHRERLRLTSEVIGGQSKTYKSSGKSLDLDYDTMEFKSILPSSNFQFDELKRLNSLEDETENKNKEAAVVLHTSELLDETEAVPYDDPANESLSESLMERFDNMETDETLPERQIVSVTILKGEGGKLGLKITGDSSGIYIDDFDEAIVRMEGNRLKKGDRLVAVNGRSLENVSYANAIDLIKKSGESVHLLVSQLKDQ